MGGHALNYETKRLSRTEYFELEAEVIPKLKELQNLIPEDKDNFAYRVIPAYRTKESFGDMDILMNKDFYNISDKNFKNKLKELFNYTDIYVNSPVYSIDYKGFQIDLIFMKGKYMKSALNYYSYNDLGNFIGRIAVRLGVRYGHYGLKYKVMTEEKDKILGEFVLTSDTKKALEFLGFDYSKFESGFETLEDIFEYVISSKYFNKEIFAYENLDHQNRTRNRKRDSYRKFLEYIEPKTFEEKPLPSREERMEMILKTFPNVELDKKISELKEKEKLQKQVKEKFNGRIIMKLIPELKGKELGDFINTFKIITTKTEGMDFDSFILKSYQSEIDFLIKQTYRMYKDKSLFI